MAGPGAPGERLLAVPFRQLAGPPWPGVGAPAMLSIQIPSEPGLVGQSLFTQGAILDSAPGAGVPVGLTQALELRVGPGAAGSPGEPEP
jgi:hypothetical protein